MKVVSLLFLLLSMLLCSCATDRPFIYPDVKQMDFGRLEWEHPRPARIVLRNGTVLYLLEDHELPLVDGYAFVRAGSVYDPEDMVGLSELTSRTIRTGGTYSRTPESIDSLIELSAARVEFRSGMEATTCSFSSLKENFDDILYTFADLLMSPSFREDRLQIELKRLEERVRRRDDSPLDLARVHFRGVLRRGHPTGRFPNASDIQKITREDLVAFHRRYYHPNNLILALAGDFDPDSVAQAVADAFAQWEKTDIDFPALPEIEDTAGRKVYYLEKNTVQSTILMGHLSIRRTNPDLFPLLIANRILGASGLSSRLFQHVREERGMAYYVGSRLNPGNTSKGEFYLICQTEGSKTVGAIELMLSEVERMREDVEPEELEDARESMENEFVFTFESPLQIARHAASLEFYGLPSTYYDDYIDNVDRTTMEAMRGAISRWFRPQDMEILIVGNAEQFDQPLSHLGNVEVLSVDE